MTGALRCAHAIASEDAWDCDPERFVAAGGLGACGMWRGWFERCQAAKVGWRGLGVGEYFHFNFVKILQDSPWTIQWEWTAQSEPFRH